MCFKCSNITISKSIIKAITGINNITIINKLIILNTKQNTVEVNFFNGSEFPWFSSIIHIHGFLNLWIMSPNILNKRG